MVCMDRSDQEYVIDLDQLLNTPSNYRSLLTIEFAHAGSRPGSAVASLHVDFFPHRFRVLFSSLYVLLLSLLYCVVSFCILRWKTNPTCNFRSKCFCGERKQLSTMTKRWREKAFILQSGRRMQNGPKIDHLPWKRPRIAGEGTLERYSRGPPSNYSHSFSIFDLAPVNNNL